MDRQAGMLLQQSVLSQKPVISLQSFSLGWQPCLTVASNDRGLHSLSDPRLRCRPTELTVFKSHWLSYNVIYIQNETSELGISTLANEQKENSLDTFININSWVRRSAFKTNIKHLRLQLFKHTVTVLQDKYPVNQLCFTGVVLKSCPIENIMVPIVQWIAAIFHEPGLHSA